MSSGITRFLRAIWDGIAGRDSTNPQDYSARDGALGSSSSSPAQPMEVLPEDLLPYKNSIIKEMYLHTADDNYIVARWSHDNELWTDFFWNSVHALEKYMKAVLLLNGVSVKKFGHDLTQLYEEVEEIAGPLLPTVLVKPEGLSIPNWQDTQPKEFIAKLGENGAPDNRYLTFGYVKLPWSLHMVDSMVWALRRLALPLDIPIVSRKQKPDAPTYRAIYAKQPKYSHDHMLSLDKLIKDDDSEARRALLNNNSAFSPKDYIHEPRPTLSSSRNPILLRFILEPLKSEKAENAERGYQMAQWLLENTRLSKPVSNEIRAAMHHALKNHPNIAYLSR